MGNLLTAGMRKGTVAIMSSKGKVDMSIDMPLSPEKVADMIETGRNANGRFRKGVSGNLDGRSRDKQLSNGEMRRIARTYTQLALDTLVSVSGNEMETGAARVSASIELLNRGHGKAVQPVEIGGPGSFDGLTDDELNEFVMKEALALIGCKDDDT